jgi:hypothetical protein
MLTNQQKWFFWPKMMVMISGKSAGGAVEVDHLRFRVNGGMCVIYIRIHICNIYIWYYILYIYVPNSQLRLTIFCWMVGVFICLTDWPTKRKTHFNIILAKIARLSRSGRSTVLHRHDSSREVQNLKFCCRDGRIVLGRRFEHRAYINCHCNLKGRRGIQLYWVGVYCDLRNH